MNNFKKIYYSLFSLLILFLLTYSACSNGDGISKSNPRDHASYILGHTVGKMIAHTGISPKSLKFEDFFLGMEESIEGKPLSLSETEVVTAYKAIRLRGEEDKKTFDKALETKTKQYILDLASKPNIKKLPNGAFYEIINEGQGPSPKVGQVVSYSWLTRRMDGTSIDSSDARKVSGTFTLPNSEKPSKVEKAPFDGVAKEVFTRMKKGSKWKITIPPELAYGSKGNSPFIQPHEVLSVEIEVLQVLDKSK